MADAGDTTSRTLDDPSVKIGLALSGGGFRASLFHIGALARLAELDLLRHVAVLSTVSGGSIIGAHYYLKVKELLEGKRADQLAPGRDAYIQIVKEVEADFLAGVQQNIRMRTFLNPLKNVRMLQENYSRSDHIAELYRDYFYAPIWRRVKEPQQTDEIYLGDIKITPRAELMPAALHGRNFDIETYNQHARFKIPIFTINATSMNTGHPWEFTSSWVGEVPPRTASARRIDANVVLERMRLDGTPFDGDLPAKKLTDEQQGKRRAKLRELTLGDAVAASACVPGLFQPLAIHDLYWSSAGDEIVVELVDGGVYDNQGIEALFAAKCTHIICSDACGQMEDELAPSTQFYNVLKRSNDILMTRTRGDGVRHLILRERGQKALMQLAPTAEQIRKELADVLNVREYAFFHLKDEFPDTAEYPHVPGPVDREGLVYRLSNLRTDLDSFTDLEACALMYDGYCLSGEQIAPLQELGAAATRTTRDTRWRFLAVRDRLRNPQGKELLHKHLRVGAHTAFKIFVLGDWRAYLAAAPLAALFAALLVYGFSVLRASRVEIDGGRLVSLLLSGGVIALLSLNKTLRKALKQYQLVRRLRNGVAVGAFYILLPTLLVSLGSVAVWVHLKIFDKLFLRSGRIVRA